MNIKEKNLQKSIDGYISNQQHLEISLTEKRIINEKYFEKMEKTSLDYQDVMSKMNELQLNVAEAETLKKDRDVRIAEFRVEIEALEAKANMANKKSVFLESESKNLVKDLEQVKYDLMICSA